jgi:hypothetical protein
MRGGQDQRRCDQVARSGRLVGRSTREQLDDAPSIGLHAQDSGAVDDSDDILDPQGWILLSFLMDPRTGLGRFRDFRISNYELMTALSLVDSGLPSTTDSGSRWSDSAGFQAPELLSGGPPSRASDVYALAACACALLTGAAPTVGSSPRTSTAIGCSLP